MYFNIEINILDQYSFECENVHMLVFISYVLHTETATLSDGEEVTRISIYRTLMMVYDSLT